MTISDVGTVLIVVMLVCAVLMFLLSFAANRWLWIVVLIACVMLVYNPFLKRWIW